MARARQEWRCLLLVLLAATASGISLDDLDDMVMNRPEEFCLLSDCLGEYTEETCPQGTRWREGVAMGGCCGACVRFMQEGETVCTGKVDSQPCYLTSTCTDVYTGYGYCDKIGKCPNLLVASERTNRAASERANRAASERANRAAPDRRGDQAKGHGPLLADEEHKQLLKSLTRAGEEQVDNVLQSSWCDFGMYCRSKVCKIEPTWVTCINTQEAFERDASTNNFEAYRDDYRWLPTCSMDGNYAPKQCKGYIDDETRACVCVDPLGNSLPGKAFKFQGSLYTDMNCLCSRRVYERQEAGETSLTLHCAENGNFEPLQCEHGWCYCVHPENGTMHGYQLPENSLNLLPCYNRTLVGDLYLRKCDSMSHAYNTLTELMFSKGIRTAPAAASSCNYDGSYSSVQCSGGKCSCVNKYSKDCLNDGSDGCECTKDQLVYAEHGRSYAELDCVELRGTYDPNQELSSLNVMYRVDAQGNRVSSVVRAACQSYLRSSKLEMCQKVGNTEDAADLYGRNYCDITCADGTITCPSSAYLFSSDYTASTSCIGA